MCCHQLCEEDIKRKIERDVMKLERRSNKVTMKYMKLGTRPDTFYTEEAKRSVYSDVPSDLTIQVNNTTYLLHKFPLLPKCGLLQRLCSDNGNSETGAIHLHEIPGGEEAFELCAKFCYGIVINLSAHNFVAAICAAKFLRMTESVEKGNLVLKLEAFFDSCILHGWKDSIVALQSTGKFSEWSEKLGIIGRCIDSVVEKILTDPSKVTWSHTYTRPGYAERRHRSVPKDWWTEDISDLDIDLFRCIIATVRSSKKLPPPLIGEALHVYASRWLPHASKGRPAESSVAQSEETATSHRRVLESVVSMIPAERGSVSGGFVLRLLKVANLVGASSSTKAELVRRSGRQLDEAAVNDLLLPLRSSSGDGGFYDIDLVGSILENYLVQFRRRGPPDSNEKSMLRVAKLIDSYLQVIAKDPNVLASKIMSLAEALPEFARPEHDDLYKAIDIYLKEHPDLSKSERKRLCRILDCRKLSPDVCMDAVRNERLPLRTVVQVLFLEQERASRTNSRKPSHDLTANRGGHGEIEEATADISEKVVVVPGPDERNHRKATPAARSKQRSASAGRNNLVGMEKKGREIIEEEAFDGGLRSKKMEIRSRLMAGHGPKVGGKHD